ncbi:hypothetical protein DSL64_16290 [Dyadobacter luteus]|jgi:hypothetical protein|uniref:Secretion system C-terminal sorting domain-containing protein n=2 Tax=Dyadobacter luteus TaxID=2259619 RepID=A0A3D8YC95_9BACT|nr:hypothetical protein DSL64_16290 [Dyadobacter luteus]
MKTHYHQHQSRIMIIVSSILLFSFHVQSQSFQIVWGMNMTLAGNSSSSNFSPSNAALTGANQHGLPTVRYYSLGGGDYAYGTTYWHTTGVPKYLEFGFSVNTFEYDLNSVSFRVRRSPDGPKSVSLRSSLDGFTSDLTTFSMSADGTFYNVSVPMGLANLSNGVTFRLYGTNANTYLGVMYFDQLVINTTVHSIVLPVSLTSFIARLQEKHVALTWETSWEKDSKNFQVERSTDLHLFTPIGSVNAAGVTEGRTQYAFTDEHPLPGANYYRLKMIDLDESYTYSVVRDIFINTEISEWTVSPNPVAYGTIIVKGHFPEIPDLQLTDMQGRPVETELVYSEIKSLYLIPLKPLPAGIYVLALTRNGKKQHAKVLVP